jgi:hypothetical protein
MKDGPQPGAAQLGLEYFCKLEYLTSAAPKKQIHDAIVQVAEAAACEVEKVETRRSSIFCTQLIPAKPA